MSYLTMQTSAPPDGPVISVNGKRLRPVSSRAAAKHLQAQIDHRFVREVEHLEREGRVFNRRQLEADLGLSKGDISVIRAGLRGISPVQLVKIFQIYRGDNDFIMYGVRNKDRSGPYVPGVGNIARYESYIHRYHSVAHWKVGPMPESQPEYFPADPENELWVAPSRIVKSDKPGAKKGPRFPKPVA